MGLLTSLTGPLPRSVSLDETLRAVEEGALEASALQRALDAATKEAVALQEIIGIDLCTDGGMDREEGEAPFLLGLSGIEAAGPVRIRGSLFRIAPRVTGEVTRAQPRTVSRWTLAREASSRPVKACLPGPYSLMDACFDEHYGSRGALGRALAEVVRAEALDLVSAGALDLQIDEPAYACRDDELALAKELLEVVSSAVRGRARLWLHLAYAEIAPVVDRIAKLPVDGILVEAANSGLDILEPLARALPGAMLVGIGVLDPHAAETETADLVRSRLKRALAVFPAERLWVVPDAGLRDLPPAEAGVRLRAMIEAAREF